MSMALEDEGEYSPLIIRDEAEGINYNDFLDLPED